MFYLLILCWNIIWGRRRREQGPITWNDSFIMYWAQRRTGRAFQYRVGSCIEKTSGSMFTWNIGWYLIFRVIPDISGYSLPANFRNWIGSSSKLGSGTRWALIGRGQSLIPGNKFKTIDFSCGLVEKILINAFPLLFLPGWRPGNLALLLPAGKNENSLSDDHSSSTI